MPFSVAAPTEQKLRDRGVEDIEDVAANVAGFTVQNLGPGQSQVAMRGVSAGQIVRDQPGVKEQVGVYLDESVDLAVAVHARPRPLRHDPRRGAARTAGHAVRLRLALRHRALHHQPAGARRARKRSASSAPAASADGGIGGSAKVAVNVPLGDTRGAARRRLLHAATAATSTPCSRI